MRLIAIPPYQNPVVKWDWVLCELLNDYRKTGALKGVEVDVDEGYMAESGSERRDEEVRALISVGVIKKVKEYSEMGKYDAIIGTGGIDPGFMPARLACTIPFVGALHSAVHIASLLGERFSIIHSTGFIRDVDSASRIMKNLVESYSLGSKLASVRLVGLWAQHTHGFVQYVYEFLIKYKDNWEERLEDPELKKIIDDTIAQCIAAIKEDGADSLIIPCEHLTACADGVRQGLNKAGYNEIPIICGLSAGLEMAKAMVNMRRLQTT